MRIGIGLGIAHQRGGGVDPAASAWASAVVAAGGTVSAARLALVSACIAGLKADGVWASLDVVQVLAAENTQSALVDWKRLTTATITGAPVFTIDREYAFDGIDDHISTLYTPGTHAVAMTGTSMMLAAYERTNVGVNAVYSAGVANNATAQNLRIGPRTATNTAIGNANSANGVSGAITDSRGLTAVQRTAAPVFEFFKNGATVGTFVPGSSGAVLPTQPIFVGAAASNTGVAQSRRAASIAAVVAGASLDLAGHTALHTRLEAFLDAIGAGVVA